jgi:DNA-binding transcriptional ArsR family regulator
MRARGHILNQVVEGLADIDAVFHALAHDARRHMVSRLAAGEMTVGQLAEPLDMSLAAASKHVKVLEQAGLVRRSVQGRRHVCRLELGPLASAGEWIRSTEDFWQTRLERLDALVASSSARDKSSGRSHDKKGKR